MITVNCQSVYLSYKLLTQLLNQHTALNSQLVEIQGERDLLQSDAKKFQDQQSQIDELNVQLRDIRTAYEAVTAEHSNCQNTISELNGQIVTLNNQITSLESNNNTLRSQVNNLEAINDVSKAYQESEPTGVGSGVYITNTGEKYHNGGCRYLKDSMISISLSAAQSRGYTACKVCH